MGHIEGRAGAGERRSYNEAEHVRVKGLPLVEVCPRCIGRSSL